MKRDYVIALVVALLVVAFVGTAGCAASSGNTQPTNDQPHAGSASSLGPTVTIRNLTFTPRSITVKAGDTVTWTNRDTTTHTVSGTDFVSGQIAPGQSYSHKFGTAGTYQYVCTIHPSMEGIVVVQ